MQAQRVPKPDPDFVLATALTRAGDHLGLKATVVAQVIGYSDGQMSKLANGKAGLSPSTKQGELALLLIRLFRSLEALVGGDEAKRHRWMSSHNLALAGVPAELIKRPDGLVRTLAYLDGMRAPT